MANGKVVVRLSSQAAEKAATLLTESEVKRLVLDVAANVDAGLSSGDIPNLRKLVWKSATHGNFEIWYLVQDIPRRVDVVTLIPCSKTTTKVTPQELMKIALKVALIGRLLYRAYQLGEKLFDHLG